MDTRGGRRETLAVLLCAVGLGIAAPRALTAQIATICDRTPSSQWGLAPSIDVLYYQGPCNPRLVPGKEAMVRVYLNWQRYPGKKTVDEYEMTAQLRSGTGEPIGCSSSSGASASVKRPDLYSAEDRRAAANSINFFGCDLDGVRELEARVTLPGRDEPITQTRKVQHMSSAQEIRARVVFPTVGSWSDGVPSQAVGAGTTLLQKGRTFALQTLPIGEVRWRIPADPAVRVVEPHLANEDGWFEESWRVEERPCTGFEDEICRTFVEEDLLVDDEVTPDNWLFRTLEDRYDGDHLVVAIVPDDFQGGWTGVTKRKSVIVGNADANTLDVRARNRALIVLRAGADPSTVAHELGHYLGLPHHDGSIVGGRTQEVEGYQSTGMGGHNKSYAEGNQDPRSDNRLFSLMADGRPDPAAPFIRFIMNPQYRVLSEDLEQDPLPTVGARAAPVRGEVAGSVPSAALPRESPLGGPSVPMAAPGSSGRATPPALVAPTVRVRGILSTDGGDGRLRHLDWTPFEVDAPRQAEGASIQVVDGSGATLASVPADARPVDSSGEVEQAASTAFSATLSWPEGARAVRLVAADGSVLDERSASSSAPTVRFLAPDDESVGERSTLRWEGRDPDGDPLRYSVFYRGDEGETWTTLAVATQEPLLERATLDPGSGPLLIVAASDGFHVATDTLAPSVALEPAPLGHVPAPGDTVAPGARIRVVLNTDLPEDIAADAPLRLTDGEGEPVVGDLRYDSRSRTLELRPSAPLRRGGRYTAHLPSGLEDRYGHRSTEEVSWSFIVWPDVDPPVVEWSDPRPGALAIPRDVRIRVRFSEPVDPGSLDDIRLVVDGDREVARSVSYDAATETATIVPDDLLPVDVTVRALVPTRVSDEHGNTLSEPFTLEFRTRARSGG